MNQPIHITNTPLAKAKGDTESEIVHKFGSISGVTTTLTPITTSGTYPTPTTLTSLELLSDNTNDALAGTGARTVEVIGLSTGFTEITEIVEMNGTTAVALSNQFYRVYRMKVVTSGTYASSVASSHAGDLTLRVVSAGATWAQIIVDGGFGLGQSEIGVYTIPAGKTGFVNFKDFDVESAKNASAYFFIREGVDVVSAPYTPMQVKEIHRNQSGHHSVHPVSPFGPFVGPCDIGFMGKAISGTANIQAEFEIELINT